MFGNNSEWGETKCLQAARVQQDLFRLWHYGSAWRTGWDV